MQCSRWNVFLNPSSGGVFPQTNNLQGNKKVDKTDKTDEADEADEADEIWFQFCEEASQRQERRAQLKRLEAAERLQDAQQEHIRRTEEEDCARRVEQEAANLQKLKRERQSRELAEMNAKAYAEGNLFREMHEMMAKELKFATLEEGEHLSEHDRIAYKAYLDANQWDLAADFGLDCEMDSEMDSEMDETEIGL